MAEHTPDKGCLNTGNDSCPDASELHAPERGGDWSPVVERLLAFRAVVSLRNWAGPGHGWKPGGSLRLPLLWTVVVSVLALPHLSQEGSPAGFQGGEGGLGH